MSDKRLLLPRSELARSGEVNTSKEGINTYQRMSLTEVRRQGQELSPPKPFIYARAHLDVR